MEEGGGKLKERASGGGGGNGVNQKGGPFNIRPVCLSERQRLGEIT